MDPDKKKQFGIAGGIILVLFVGWLMFRGKSGGLSADNADGFRMLCRNPECKNEFVISQSKFLDLKKNHVGEPIHCPKCNGTDVVQIPNK